MQIVSDILKLQKTTTQLARRGKSIGFVATMGALHAGHRSLIEASKAENDITIVSIFVNPEQFGPHEDLTKYPRPLEKDQELLEKLEVEYLFHPILEFIYPQEYKTFITVKNISGIWEGETRPGHFTGVTTIVAKLFNIVQPTNAYFGQKDLQQFIIIKKMTAELNFSINLHMIPIIRDKDGLAFSSRNVYLNREERNEALALFQSLEVAKKLLNMGERDPAKIHAKIKQHIEKHKLLKIDYIAICEPVNLLPVKIISNDVVILLAVSAGKTRLIDNIIINI